MSLNDPISNMLTIIRNAIQVRKETVDIPASHLIGKILDIFKKDNYIEDFRMMKDSAQGSFKVYLKYKDDKDVVIGLKRISKPGLRVYSSRNKIPRVLNGLGTAVLSTSEGVISDRDAREKKIGGEVLCYIW